MNYDINRLNFKEIEFFYKAPNSLTDFSQMTSFSLIKSCVEVLVYYDITSFTSTDIKQFFQRLQIVQKKNNKVFIPSAKKIDGVMQCYLSGTKDSLSFENGVYSIASWDCSGYGYAIKAAYDNNKI